MTTATEAKVLQVGLLATMPDDSLRFVSEDGQVQAIAASARFDVLPEGAKIDLEGCSPEVREMLNQLHNRVVMIDARRDDPQQQLQAKIKDNILGVLKEAKVTRAMYVREHFGLLMGQDLEFEHALSCAWNDVKLIISPS